MNVKRHSLWFLTLLIGVIFISSRFDTHPNNTDYINTIYTVSGIMFSIGMGVVCTMNPDSIKNPHIYNTIRTNIIVVRNTYLLYFGIISSLYFISQLVSEPRYKWHVFSYSITLDLYYLCIAFNILSIIYYIVNFIEIQQLNFDISDEIKKN
jgi:hypothetical protein